MCGGIDANGAVIAHPVYRGDDVNHTPAEASISSWRWDVTGQCFMDHSIPQKRDLTDDELFAIADWLIKNGYAEEESF